MRSTAFVAAGALAVASTVAASPELPQVFHQILARQAPGSAEYQCHSDCGYTIIGSRTDGYCDDASWKALLDACLACANTYDMWGDYGKGVTAAAEGCGLSAVPVDASTPAPSTSAPAPSTSAPAPSSSAPAPSQSSSAPQSSAAQSSAPQSSAAQSSAAQTSGAQSSAAQTTKPSAAPTTTGSGNGTAQPTHATITAGASRMAIGSAVLGAGAFVAALMI